MSRSQAGIASLAVLLFSAAAIAHGTAQQGGPPPARPARAGATPSATGAAVLGGTVIEDNTIGRPVRHATVTLRNVDLNSSRVVLTDDAGQFVFQDLSAGRFTLAFAKPAYVSAIYGAKSARTEGLTIALAEGQHLENVVGRIARGAVITGQVLDQAGRPVSGSRVSVAERVVVNGQPTYRSTGSGSQADDKGVYRIFGLPAGSYVVRGSIGGGPAAGSPRLTTAADVRWAAGPATSAPPALGANVKYATVFYPGTVDPAGAAVVTVAAGEERAGIDFTMPLVPTARLEGTVTQADGQPLRSALVMVVPKTMTANSQFFDASQHDTVTALGRFSISGLQPGRYLVTARAMDQWAVADLDVTGPDVSNVSLTLAPGMTLSGRVVFEGTAALRSSDLSNVTVDVGPPPGVDATLGAPSVHANGDGTFTLTGVAPGSYFIRSSANGPSAGTPTWVLKSATAGGRDLLDTAFEVRPGEDVKDVVITFTDRVTQLTGTLTDQTGHPAPTYFLMAFPTNATLWRSPSRWLRSPIRPATDGRFSLIGLPPGEYYLAAVAEYPQSDWSTPSFLEQLIAAAIKVTLAEGERKTQDLKLAGGG